MKTKFILSLFICLLMGNTYAQNFEGVIIYRNAYKSKIPNLSDEQFTTMMGARQEYAIQGGNYKSTMNGTLVLWQLYINQHNKLYSKMSNVQSILWNDGGKNPDEVLKSEINKNAIEILGYLCDELVLTCKTGIQKFYFNTSLKVDATLYANHKFGNWNEIMSKTNSLPLKIIIENHQFIVESIAIEIKPMPIDVNLFVLPEGVKLEKSPY